MAALFFALMFSALYRQHYRANLKIAAPIVLGRIGLMATAIADTAMVGQVGTEPLAGASLANSIFYFIGMLAIGMPVGITPLVGKAHGEGDKVRIAALLKNGLFFSVILGLGVSLAMYFTAFGLGHLDQSPETVREALPYYKILIYSLLPWTIFIVFQQFAEGLEITMPATLISVGSNLVNIGLNYVFIYGKLGFPAMGLEGAGWATLISRLLMMIGIIYYMWRSPKMRAYLKSAWQSALESKMIMRIVGMGMPISLQMIFEMGAFTVGAIMVGWSGSDQQAAHHIAIMVVATTYHMASGIGSTATVRISNFLGRRNPEGIKVAGYTSLLMVLLFMGLCSIAIVLSGDHLPRLFTIEENVIALAATLLLIAALFQLFDGVQVTALGALRGIQDVKIPTLIAVVSYWIVMVPIAYYLAEIKAMGAIGVWIGYLAGLGASSILLFIRYEWKSKRVLAKLAR